MSADIIFLNPGSLEIDFNGRNTLKLRSADKLGKTGMIDNRLHT
jgi:hypothetical protein